MCNTFVKKLFFDRDFNKIILKSVDIKYDTSYKVWKMYALPDILNFLDNLYYEQMISIKFVRSKRVISAKNVYITVAEW